MASKVLSLSEEDAEILRRIIREIKQNPRPQSRYREEREIGQSPEVYVARTPPGGIPAIFDYPGTAADIPGSAECDVYRATVVDGVRRLFEVTGLTRIVHSLSYTAVPGNIYVKIERDKFGVWWVSSTPAQLDPGPDTPPDPSDPTGTGTGTGTGPIFGCDFTAEELESIAGPGLGVDFTEDCPRLQVETTPPNCLAVVVYETDLRCETATGTGTSQEGSLNLYRRKVTINVEGGCLTKTNGEWEFIRAVACCDPSCEQEASQERFWWCINSGESGGEVTPGEDCASAPEVDLTTEYGPFTSTTGGASKWIKFPTGLSGTHKATITVTAFGGGSAVARLWPAADCGSLGMGNSVILDGTGTFCVEDTIVDEMWFEVDPSSLAASITFTVELSAGSC